MTDHSGKVVVDEVPKTPVCWKNAGSSRRRKLRYSHFDVAVARFPRHKLKTRSRLVLTQVHLRDLVRSYFSPCLLSDT